MSPQTELLAEMRQEVTQRLGPELQTLTLERVAIGVFFTGVILNNGIGGLCATPIKSIPEAVCCPSSAMALPAAGRLCGRPVSRILEDLSPSVPMRCALAIATLNALVETLWLRDGPPEGWEIVSGDAFKVMRYQPDDSIALVGAFPPYMRALRKAAQPFRVLEMDQKTLTPEELQWYTPAEQAPAVLPECQALIVTGSTLVNGTLESLLTLCKAGTEIGVIGPTVPLLPGPLNRRGVTVIGGVRVQTPQKLLNLLNEGASGYHLFSNSVERVTLYTKE